MLVLRSHAQVDLFEIIRSVRRRWRLKMLLRGLAIVAGVGAIVVLLSSFVLDAARFDAGAVLAARIVLYAALLALAVRFVVLPLTRTVSDERVALYIEEHEPSLQMALASALDVKRQGRAGATLSPALTRRLVEIALDRCRRVEYGQGIDRRSLYQSSGTLAGLAVLGAALFLLNPGFIRHAVPFLLPLGAGEAANPYAVAVAPGDTLLARGADQLVTAELIGFEADVVEVAVKRGDQEWERFEMAVGSESGRHEIFLFDLDEATDYYVESSGVRSPVYRIDVADLPYVQRIDLEIRYPAYAGLSPATIEDGGDIAALRGSQVTLTILPTLAVTAGRLIVDGEEPAPLEPLPDGRLSGALRVQRQGYYRIELEAVNGRMVPASPDYTIDALDDQPPTVSFLKPGRDTKVTNVEEVFVEAQAEDDYGLARFDLMISVNGGPEDTVPLFEGSRRLRELAAGHTFYLEEMALEPGDLISYYAQVGDNRSGGGQEATTDIYFMEVRPFRRDYRQADQQGGGGGGGGGELDGTLTVQQRQIVSATFKMVRDEDEYERDDYHENLATLALAQGRVRERVEAIVRRMQDRGIVRMDSGFRAVIEELPLAMAEMETAEEELGRRDPQAALPAAQRALQHLQRADAAFREVQVSQGGGGGGGGGGGAANAEDLADLFELELDKLRNQYETVQRGQQQQADQEIDATLQRLRELAQRQQQENERMRRRAQQLQQQGQAGGGGGAQRQLAEETEELARQLERLAREQSLPNLEETARRLQQAADAMRRAAASGRSGELGEGMNALERLRDAREDLEDSRSARLQRDAADALRRAERLLEDQAEIADEVRDLPEEGGDRAERIARLRERKDEMAAEVADLETRLDRMARESRGDQPEASRQLQGAAGSIRENRLSEKIRYSRGVIAGRSREYAANFEDQIGANLEELRDRIAEATGSITEGADQEQARTLDQARSLVRGLESLRDRMEERAEQRAGEAGGEAEQNREGGQPSEGRQGQQGQQGQQGERGQQGQQGQGGEGGEGAQAGQQGGRGGAGDRGFAPGGSGGPIGWGRLDPQDVRQFRSEFGQRRGEAERLREALRQQGVDVGDMGVILERLRELERARTYDDPEEIRRLQMAVIEGLKEFEYALRREILGDEDGSLVLSSSDDVPPGFRELVEEYYKALSQSARRD